MDLASMVKKKNDKIKTISCHVLRNNELNSVKEKRLEMADSMSRMLTSKMTNHSQMTIM